MLQTYQYLKLVRLYSEAMCNTTKMIFYSTPLTCELTKENPSNLPSLLQNIFQMYSLLFIDASMFQTCNGGEEEAEIKRIENERDITNVGRS